MGEVVHCGEGDISEVSIFSLSFAMDLKLL